MKGIVVAGVCTCLLLVLLVIWSSYKDDVGNSENVQKTTANHQITQGANKIAVVDQKNKVVAKSTPPPVREQKSPELQLEIAEQLETHQNVKKILAHKSIQQYERLAAKRYRNVGDIRRIPRMLHELDGKIRSEKDPVLLAVMLKDKQALLQRENVLQRIERERTIRSYMEQERAKYRGVRDKRGISLILKKLEKKIVAETDKRMQGVMIEDAQKLRSILGGSEGSNIE